MAVASCWSYSLGYKFDNLGYKFNKYAKYSPLLITNLVIL